MATDYRPWLRNTNVLSVHLNNVTLIIEPAWLNSCIFSGTFPFNQMIIREVNCLSGSLKNLHYYMLSKLLHSSKMTLAQGRSCNTKAHAQHTSIHTNLKLRCGTILYYVLNVACLCFLSQDGRM